MSVNVNREWMINVHQERDDVLVELVRNMTRRSMPIPQPPVGGRPCSILHISNFSTILMHGAKDKYARINVHLIYPLRLVVSLLLLPHLLLEAQALLEGVVQLRVGVAELLSTHEALETLAETGTGAVVLGKWGHDLWVADWLSG